MQRVFKKRLRNRIIFYMLFFIILSGTIMAQHEITDTTIRNAVSDALMDDIGVNANNIDVGSQDGIVTLAGSVKSIQSKERSVRIAQTVKGVRVS